MFTGQQVFAIAAVCSVVFALGGIFITGHILGEKCKHDWEKIYDGKSAHNWNVIIYRCRRCGKIQKIKVE